MTTFSTFEQFTGATNRYPSLADLDAAGLCSDPVPGALPTGSLSPVPDDRPDRRSYDAIFIRAGYVKKADGSDSNWLIPAETLHQDLQLFDGVACYLDHPEMFGFGWRGEPQVKNLFGVTSDVRYDVTLNAITGKITLYDQDPHSPGAFVGQLLDQILADQQAGRPIPTVGLSAVFFHEAEIDEETGAKVTTRFKKVESVDLVYSAGAGGYVRNALAAMPTIERSPSPMEDPQETRNPTTPDGLAESAGTAEALENQVAGLDAAVRQLQDQIQTLTADLDGSPPVDAGQSAATLEDLHAQVQHLTRLVAGQQNPIQGMGHAPADGATGARYHLSTPMDQIQAAWDWIFGVRGASTPPPELRRTDYLYRLLSGDLNWTGVFDQREALANANATTLAGMVVNAMNKVIVPLYDRLMVYRWYEPIVTVQPTDGSLHDMAWLQFGGIGDLPVVADGAAYTELSVDDSKETSAFYKYGGYVGITEKVIRNSDVAKIQAIPRALTVAAVQTRSAKIAAIFTDNSGQGPTLSQDSNYLFKSNNAHSNYATTAFSWTAWKAARVECAKHAELASSKRTGFFPKFGLFPVDLYDEALQVFGYGQGPGGQPGTADNDVNPYGVSRPGDPRPVPIAVPDWTDTNDWAYVVDPLIAPVIQMAYADNPSGNGHPPPQLYTVTSKLAGLMFTNDVLPIKVRDYFAYGVATYRGIGKRVVS
jgi:hypothetical protein